MRGLGHVLLAVVLAVAPDATRLIVPLLVALGLVSGVAGALLTPALAAAIPDLVPAGNLAAANSLHHMSSQGATLAGQAAGGLGYTWIGASGLVLFDGLAFIFSAGCAALARVPQPSRPTTPAVRDRATAYLREIREGVSWLWGRPALRSLILAFRAVNFLFTFVFVLLPVYVKDVLGRGPERYGYLLAAAGGGALAGAAVAPVALRGHAGMSRALLGIGACTAALGGCRWAAPAATLLFGLGLVSGILNVRVMTTLQSSTPAELRGRVLAVTVALAGAAVPAGLGLGGLLGDLARPALSTLILGCGAGIVGVAGAFGMRRHAGDGLQLDG